jgi:hypothetical protein
MEEQSSKYSAEIKTLIQSNDSRYSSLEKIYSERITALENDFKGQKTVLESEQGRLNEKIRSMMDDLARKQGNFDADIQTMKSKNEMELQNLRLSHEKVSQAETEKMMELMSSLKKDFGDKLLAADEALRVTKEDHSKQVKEMNAKFIGDLQREKASHESELSAFMEKTRVQQESYDKQMKVKGAMIDTLSAKVLMLEGDLVAKEMTVSKLTLLSDGKDKGVAASAIGGGETIRPEPTSVEEFKG